MSKRFESVNKDFFSYIEDNRSGLLYCTTNHNDMKDLANLLNKQAQRIAELEEQLKNAIVLKFKPHNDLFVIVGYKNEPKSIEQYYIDEIVIRGNGKFIEYRDIEKETIIGENNLLFATKEEAEAKLRDLEGESK